jgi:hypothetical protein
MGETISYAHALSMDAAAARHFSNFNSPCTAALYDWRIDVVSSSQSVVKYVFSRCLACVL